MDAGASISVLPAHAGSAAAPRLASSSWTTPLPRRVWMVGLAVVALNLVDAFGTLRHLSHGAEELNPLMARLLEAGPVPFVLGKHALASAGVVGILAHARYRAARIALTYVLCPIYLGIAAYQLALLSVIP